MAFRQSTYRCWQGLSKVARCKFCRRRIAWVTTDQNKRLPFDPGAPVVRVDQHPETFAKFDVFDAAHLHFRTCPKRDARAAATKAKKTTTSRFAAQGRLL